MHVHNLSYTPAGYRLYPEGVSAWLGYNCGWRQYLRGWLLWLWLIVADVVAVAGSNSCVASINGGNDGMAMVMVIIGTIVAWGYNIRGAI